MMDIDTQGQDDIGPTPSRGTTKIRIRGVTLEVPIRDFTDLRRLRRLYRNSVTGVYPPRVLNEQPLLGGEEEEFGLVRSTEEEAWQFYLESLNADEEEDDLTEFLNDS